MKAIDRLMRAVEKKQNPTVLGLDTRYEYLPQQEPLGDDWQSKCARRILDFNRQLIDALCGIIPAVKVQAAYYEMLGIQGIQVFAQTLAYAQEMGMLVISDVKRGDIGPTAEAYAAAYVGQSMVDGRKMHAFACDFATVNPYLGSDGVLPFVEACQKQDTGIFVLVKTSNPSGGEFQDLLCDGRPVYEHVAEKVAQWGEGLTGERGYSSVGAVVGATYPKQGAALRDQMPHTYFLLPGYGAQGATAKEMAGCFDAKGQGAVVNASRSLLCAHQKHEGMHFADAARVEAERMREDLLSAIGAIG